MSLIISIFFAFLVVAEPPSAHFCDQFRNCESKVWEESTHCLNGAVRKARLVKRMMESRVSVKIAEEFREEGWVEAYEPFDEGTVRFARPGPKCGGNAGQAQVFCDGRWGGAKDPAPECDSFDRPRESPLVSGLTTKRLAGVHAKDAPRFLLKDHFVEILAEGPMPEGAIRVVGAELLL